MDPGQTARVAPLPFQIGVGASSTINTSLAIRILVQSNVTKGGTPPPGPTPGGGGGTACNPLVYEFCVPSAAITLDTPPVAAIRCDIT